KTIKFKGAIADGQEITFEAALKRPTREQAIGRVLSLVLAPASRLASQILGPAAHVAGQVKTLRDRKEEAPASETAAPEGAAPAARVARPAGGRWEQAITHRCHASDSTVTILARPPRSGDWN